MCQRDFVWRGRGEGLAWSKSMARENIARRLHAATCIGGGEKGAARSAWRRAVDSSIARATSSNAAPRREAHFDARNN